jgi:hypothetical protein
MEKLKVKIYKKKSQIWFQSFCIIKFLLKFPLIKNSAKKGFQNELAHKINPFHFIQKKSIYEKHNKKKLSIELIKWKIIYFHLLKKFSEYSNFLFPLSFTIQIIIISFYFVLINLSVFFHFSVSIGKFKLKEKLVSLISIKFSNKSFWRKFSESFEFFEWRRFFMNLICLTIEILFIVKFWIILRYF